MELNVLIKKRYIFLIIFVCLFTISTVSAEDVGNETNIISTNEFDNTIELSIENKIINYNADGSFTDLAKEISNANGELILTRNYVYNPSEDYSNYKNGIEINKEITINGKGFVIDGINQACAFKVSSNKVILKNLEFTNCSSTTGGAIYWSGSQGKLFDCSFIDCYSSSSGGAVYWYGDYGNLYTCSFIDCYSSSSGGAVYWYGDYGNLYDCSFSNCYCLNSKSDGGISYRPSSSINVITNSYGGAVYWNSYKGNLFNCDFINCYSSSSSMATASVSARDYSKDPYRGSSASTVSISNSESYGGAIYWKGSYGNLYNCSFVNCYSKSYSNSHSSSRFTHYIEIMNTYGTSEYFCDCYSISSSSSYASIYLASGECNLINCNFINSTASHDSDSDSDKDSGSYVKANSDASSSTYGGAIYWAGSYGSISDCKFKNSKYNPTSSLGHDDTVYWNAKGNQFNCSFNGNYYNYDEYCGKSASVYPIILIRNSTLNDDETILIFECTPLVNNITVTLYNVTDRKILYDEFDISYEDLVSSFNLNNYEEGEYQIVLNYAGDNFYSATSSNNLFKIGKNSPFEVTVSENNIVGNNVTINLTLNGDAKGKVKITLSNYTCINELIGGKTSFTVPNLNGGINTFKIKYEGDETYNPIYINDSFKVFLKSDISLNLKENYIFEENIALKYSIAPNCTGIISIFVDNKFKSNISVNDIFELKNINVGKHNISVFYNGDENHVCSNYSTMIIVSKADPTIKASPSSNMPGNVPFEVILNKKATGKVILTINNTSYSGSLINGKTSIVVPNVNAGNYTVKIAYEGDKNYNGVICDTDLTINQIPTSILGTVNDITYPQNCILNVKCSVDGSVVVKIDDNYIKNVNIKANTTTSISFENIPAGKHNVKITLKPINNNYEESIYNTEFTISKKQTSILSTVDDITYSQNSIINVKGSVDGSVVVKIDDKYEKKINVKANIITPVTFNNISAGNHEVSVVLTPSNKNYLESSHNTDFTVSKKQTSVNLNVTDMNYGEEVIINVTASDDGKITLTVGDKVYEKSILANKLLQINLGLLESGTYDVNVIFSAGNNYKTSSAGDNLVISPLKSNIDAIETANNIYGEDTIIKVKTNVTGLLSVKIGNYIKNREVIANKFSVFNFGILNVNKYDVEITIDAGKNYIKTTNRTQINVLSNIVENNDLTKYYNEPDKFSVRVLSNIGSYASGQKVKFVIGKNTYESISNSNGYSYLNVQLQPGNYIVKTSYNGNEVSNKIKILATLYNDDIKVSSFNIIQGESETIQVVLPKDTTGKVTTTINGEEYSANVNNGIGNIIIPNLKYGTYNIEVVYSGDSQYNSVKATTSFVVEGVINLSVPDVTKNYGGSERLYIYLKDKTNKPINNAEIKISLNGVTFLRTTNNEGVSSIDLDLNSGTYDAIVSYDDVSTTAKVIINQLSSKTTLSITKNSHDSVTLVANVSPSDITGDVVFAINENRYIAKVSDSKFSYTIFNLAAGKYNAQAIFNGDVNHKSSSSNSITFNIEEIPFILSAPDVVKYYGGSERFIVTLKDRNGQPITNANIKISLNGASYTRTTNNMGSTSIGINLNSGKYNVTTEYNGIKAYSTVTVKDTVISNDFTKIFRNDTQYYATFIDSQGNLLKNTQVKLNINGVYYTRTTNDQGIAKMNINLNPGTYVLTATNPASGEQHTTVIKVLPSIVENHDLTKYYRNESKYTLRILDSKGNPVGAGVTVKLNINGVFYERKTNASGYMNMNINLIPGTYIVTAEYNGLMASNTVRVLPILSAKDVNMKYRDGTKFELKLLNGKGNPFAAQKITFNINGVFYERITDSNGIARLNINLQAGEYIITSMYENGAALANKVTISS